MEWSNFSGYIVVFNCLRVASSVPWTSWFLVDQSKNHWFHHMNFFKLICHRCPVINFVLMVALDRDYHLSWYWLHLSPNWPIKICLHPIDSYWSLTGRMSSGNLVVSMSPVDCDSPWNHAWIARSNSKYFRFGHVLFVANFFISLLVSIELCWDQSIE